LTAGGRAGVARELNSGVPSAFPFCQPFGCCGLFRVAVLDQLLKSPAAGIGLPFVEAFEVMVPVDEFDDVDETDDEELVRCMVLRFANMLMPRRSSAFIEFGVWLPLIHPGRLRFTKLGGLATAVMSRRASAGHEDKNARGYDAC